MSDHIDNNGKIIFAEVARGLAAVRGTWLLPLLRRGAGTCVAVL
ncbi:hypothetical protein O3297_00800 [Janthinobacterium sp. SUN128]|nr:hypothetical protein [Janthinobacterium sp. SUN128]MDO8031940.1 hypothetical protein [Janthinobacterium sp. SUN128]